MAGAHSRSTLVPAVLVLAGAALSSWEATLSRQTAGGQRAVLVVVGGTVLAAGALGRGRQQRPVADGMRDPLGAIGRARRGRVAAGVVAGTITWIVLATAAVGWDLYSFARQRHDLPTLSRLIGDVTHLAWGRGLVFAAWLALGGYLAAGRRRAASDAPAPGHGGHAGSGRRST